MDSQKNSSCLLWYKIVHSISLPTWIYLLFQNVSGASETPYVMVHNALNCTVFISRSEQVDS